MININQPHNKSDHTPLLNRSLDLGYHPQQPLMTDPPSVRTKLTPERAKDLVIKIHAGQTDKAGAPYFQHLETVASKLADQGESEDVIIVGWLHDSIEDTNITVGEIRDLFGDEVSTAVDAITKRKGEPYQDYLIRVKSNKIARVVKLADLSHNMDLSRLTQITDKDLKRLEKYQRAKEFLLS